VVGVGGVGVCVGGVGVPPTPYVRHSTDCTCCDFGHQTIYYYKVPFYSSAKLHRCQFTAMPKYSGAKLQWCQMTATPICCCSTAFYPQGFLVFLVLVFLFLLSVALAVVVVVVVLFDLV
jgi:hypothetical protein